VDSITSATPPPARLRARSWATALAWALSALIWSRGRWWLFAVGAVMGLLLGTLVLVANRRRRITFSEVSITVINWRGKDIRIPVRNVDTVAFRLLSAPRRRAIPSVFFVDKQRHVLLAVAANPGWEKSLRHGAHQLNLATDGNFEVVDDVKSLSRRWTGVVDPMNPQLRHFRSAAVASTFGLLTWPFALIALTATSGAAHASVSGLLGATAAAALVGSGTYAVARLVEQTPTPPSGAS
jgi:hypothetical protein